MRGVYPNLEPRQPMGGKCGWQLRGMTPPKRGWCSRPGKIQMVLKFKQVSQT